MRQRTFQGIIRSVVIMKFHWLTTSIILWNLMLGTVKLTLFLSLNPWNFWKSMPRTCSPLCYTWQTILGQERLNQALLTTFLSLKVLVKLCGILFLPFMNLVGILSILTITLTITTTLSKIELLTNLLPRFQRSKLYQTLVHLRTRQQK